MSDNEEDAVPKDQPKGAAVNPPTQAQRQEQSGELRGRIRDLRRYRGQRKGMVTRCEGKLERLLREQAPEEDLKHVVEVAKNAFGELEGAHDALLALVDDLDDWDLREEEEAWFYKAERSYIDLLKKAEPRLHPVDAKPSALSTEAPIFHPQGAAVGFEQQPRASAVDQLDAIVGALRLPEPTIKKFEGDVKEYHPFMTAFQARIVSRTSAAIDRLYYLEQHLSGRPKDLVAHCFHLPPEKGYQEALSVLEEHFGDPYRISMAYMKDITACPPVKKDDSSSLNVFSLLLIKCKCAMDAMPDLCILDHPHTMQSIVGKLPIQLIHKWRNLVHDLELSHRVASFADLSAFVKRQADAASHPVYGLDAMAPEKPSATKNEVQIAANSTGVSETGPGRDSICSCCKAGKHSLRQCFKFKSLNVTERKSFIKENGVCFGCLLPGHRVFKCTRRLKCERCHHHSRMPFKLKNQVFEAALLSAVLYSSESWLTNNVQGLEKQYHRALKALLGV